MELRDGAEGLSKFVREHRVRFTVAPETVIRGDGRVPVGFDVRLLASHGHERHDLERCAVCAELEARLHELAEFSTRAEESPAQIEIDPDYSGLYESLDAPGTDDVALDLRLFVRGKDDHGVGDPERRFLREVKARLKVLGARER